MIRSLTMKWLWLFLLALAVIGVGCASDRHPTTRPSSALDDPMDYKPAMNEQDISGGGIDHYDRAAVKRDVDHVLNP
jgi:hypothetical protein